MERGGVIFRHYTETLCAMVPLDEAAARAAIRVRHACPTRLPLASPDVDGIINQIAS